MLFIDETKRSDLPDSEFGIPEDRKFPLDTAEHVHSAIKLFGHTEESKRKSLAKRIASKAKSYGIEIPETSQVYKYLHENSNMTANQVDAFYTELKKRLAEDDEVITESAILESSKNNYKKIYDITIKMFKDSGRLPNADNGELKQFLATGKTDEFGGALCIAGLGTGYEGTCSKINKEIKPLGGRIHPDNYGTAMLSIKEDAVLTDEDDDDLDLPSTVIGPSKSIIEILDSVNPKNIYITSDWHIFKNHYTKEKNHVNTSEIISWCKDNIKDDNVFLYLGDMSYRWINDKDKEEVKKIFKSLPGIKILVIGNHDEFSDGGDYEDYGFKYAVKDIYYKNIIFSHRPIDMSDKPGMLNIHGHKHHKDTEYHSMNGDANVNVYPSFHNNKPITLDRAINHKDWYMRNNKRSDWNGMSEANVEKQIKIQDNIKNIIFDFGSVLIDDDNMIESLENNPNIPSEYAQSIYDFIGTELFGNAPDNLDWASIDEVKAYFNSKAPDELKQYTDYIFECFATSIRLYNYTNNLLDTLKEKGYKLYYLSNWSKYSYEYQKPLFDQLIEKFDGGLFSWECHMSKPDLSIYNLLLNKYDLLPEESLFFDDKEDNITYAKVCGINAILFDHNTTPYEILNGLDETNNLVQEASSMINDIINKPKEMQEWAMNACNPIIGIQKPYVLKAIDNTGDCINSKLYALSPDIISDKYLVVDENSKLAIVDKSYFDNYYVEVYEYTGNRLNIGKIKEMYDSGNIVSPNYIYETLSGKHLLTQDQIDFDDQFKKVDFSDDIAKMESYRATMQSNFDKINGAFFYIPAMNIQQECTINYKNALDVMADVNGYYLRNRFTHERTESVSDVNQLTEAMIKSISIN